jgi:Flp pilus assembly protein TadD
MNHGEIRVRKIPDSVSLHPGYASYTSVPAPERRLQLPGLAYRRYQVENHPKKNRAGGTMTPQITPSWRLILLMVLMGFAPLAHALTPNEIFEAVKDSVVVVKTLDTKGKEKSQGSGVLLPSGKVGTNCHVVEGGASFQIGRNKTFIPATLHAGDRDKDICLLDAPGIKGRAAQLGKAKDLKVGEAVYAVGAPQGLELSLSDGIVSQLRGDKTPLIQTTAAISPGSSGGGLFDAQARLVGFTTLYLEGGQNLNFAVPVEWLADIQPGRKPVAKARGSTDWSTRTFALEVRKDWNGLLDWCKQWTSAEPENDWAWTGLGDAYFGLKRYSDAIDAYRKSVRINPELPGAWCGLGNAYNKLQRFNEAIDAYRHALRINSEDAETWYGLGIVYGNMNRHEEAITAYREALRLKPDHDSVWNNLGATYGKMGRYQDAIKAFHEALRLKPDDASSWAGLGLSYHMLGNRGKALEAVQILRRYDPTKAEKLFNLIGG